MRPGASCLYVSLSTSSGPRGTDEFGKSRGRVHDYPSLQWAMSIDVLCRLLNLVQPVGLRVRTKQRSTHLGGANSMEAILVRISELDSELGLEGRRRWTDAGDAVDSVAPKLSIVVDDKEDQVAVLGVAQ